MQVDVSPNGLAAFWFSRYYPYEVAARPFLIRSFSGKVFAPERRIPSLADAAPDSARSIAVLDDATVAVALSSGSPDAYQDHFVQLTISRDFGQTFSVPINIVVYHRTTGALDAVRPSLTLDPQGTVHVVYEGPFGDATGGIDLREIVYLSARYE
jgi:hypothetical protein